MQTLCREIKGGAVLQDDMRLAVDGQTALVHLLTIHDIPTVQLGRRPILVDDGVLRYRPLLPPLKYEQLSNAHPCARLSYS